MLKRGATLLFVREGKQELFVAAGPCSAQSEEQLLATAFPLKACGKVCLFRVEIWKVGSSKEAEALPWLETVKRETGLPVAIEVATAGHVELALKHGIDVLWLGANTTVSPFSVQGIADSLKGVSVPVMIKNPINADLSLWMGAIERMAHGSSGHIMAVHRGLGIHPVWRISTELKRHFPQLPIVFDPTHIYGRKMSIPEICQKALDRGMSGLMVEVQCHPESPQRFTPEEFCRMLDRLQIGREDSQGAVFLKDKLNAVDRELLGVLEMRMDIVDKIGRLKKENDITAFQVARMNEIIQSYRQQAESLNLEKGYIEKIYHIIHNESVKRQLKK